MTKLKSCQLLSPELTPVYSMGRAHHPDTPTHVYTLMHTPEPAGAHHPDTPTHVYTLMHTSKPSHTHAHTHIHPHTLNLHIPVYTLIHIYTPHPQPLPHPCIPTHMPHTPNLHTHATNSHSHTPTLRTGWPAPRGSQGTGWRPEVSTPQKFRRFRLAFMPPSPSFFRLYEHDESHPRSNHFQNSRDIGRHRDLVTLPFPPLAASR